ncbi:hypothetical protein CWE21_11830 [Pseudidiomarina aquimaris]|uniref:Uncharacterized protein n=1 Tax=Pseudidiomarina aquimaris TaxID=641841 RepID=A0A432XD07_9GAMM|nr:hypothetical protein CWE21_11830 [Pseudidiomarina aquimaris]
MFDKAKQRAFLVLLFALNEHQTANIKQRSSLLVFALNEQRTANIKHRFSLFALRFFRKFGPNKRTIHFTILN